MGEFWRGVLAVLGAEAVLVALTFVVLAHRASMDSYTMCRFCRHRASGLFQSRRTRIHRFMRHRQTVKVFLAALAEGKSPDEATALAKTEHPTTSCEHTWGVCDTFDVDGSFGQHLCSAAAARPHVHRCVDCRARSVDGLGQAF